MTSTGKSLASATPAAASATTSSKDPPVSRSCCRTLPATSSSFSNTRNDAGRDTDCADVLVHAVSHRPRHRSDGGQRRCGLVLTAECGSTRRCHCSRGAPLHSYVRSHAPRLDSALGLG